MPGGVNQAREGPPSIRTLLDRYYNYLLANHEGKSGFGQPYFVIVAVAERVGKGGRRGTGPVVEPKCDDSTTIPNYEVEGLNAKRRAGSRRSIK